MTARRDAPVAAAAASSGAYQPHIGAGSAYQGGMLGYARSYKHTHSILFDLKKAFEGQLR